MSGSFFEQAFAPGSLNGSLAVGPEETIVRTLLAIALLLLLSSAGYLYVRRELLVRTLAYRFNALRSTTALPGDVLPFVDGSEVRVPSGSANGEALEIEMLLPPSTESPPKHIHPGQDEEYEVLDGTLDVFIRGEWHTVNAGERATVPRREAHTFRVGDEPARVRTVHDPGLDLEDYFATESALARAGKIKSHSSPRAVLHYAVLLSEYFHCIVMADRSQRVLLRALAPVGRVLGFGRP